MDNNYWRMEMQSDQTIIQYLGLCIISDYGLPCGCCECITAGAIPGEIPGEVPHSRAKLHRSGGTHLHSFLYIRLTLVQCKQLCALL
jgi:hypothetical protein